MNLIKHPLLFVALVLGALLVLILASHPMMYPGFDVWIHLARIEYHPPGGRVWYDVWREVFGLLQIDNVFDRALLIHRVQLLLTVGMVGLSAYGVLLTVFERTYVKRSALVLQSMCAVWLWLVMHGTVSTPVAGDRPFIQSWLLWYSVNYQITLPMYFLSAAALLRAWVGVVTPRERLGLLLVVFLGAVVIAKVHASELPYLLFMGLVLLGLGFRWRWRWWFLGAGVAAGVLMVLAVKSIGHLPRGWVTLQNEGWSGLFMAISNYGDWMVSRGNRGQASWNFYHWMGLGAAAWAVYLLARTQHINRQAVAFVLLSAIPAAALHWKWSAGAMAMAIYPEIAWRFAFSSFLFVGVPLLVLALGLKYAALAKHAYPLLLTAAISSAVMVASFRFEPHHVAFQYTRSIIHTLSPGRVNFGLTPENQAWLKQADQALRAEAQQGPVCADIFSAYYLYFVYRQHRMILPNNIELHLGDCRYPRDGGDLKRLPIEPPPWTF
jgi:hypothetical protein